MANEEKYFSNSASINSHFWAHSDSISIEIQAQALRYLKTSLIDCLAPLSFLLLLTFANFNRNAEFRFGVCNFPLRNVWTILMDELARFTSYLQALINFFNTTLNLYSLKFLNLQIFSTNYVINELYE